MGDIRTATSTSPIISSLLNDPMRKETERLETFKSKVPILSETEKTLAAKGFFYSEAIKKVQCFACGVRFDFPLNFALRSVEEEHRKSSSDCEFLKSQNKAGNIPREVINKTVTTVNNNSSRVSQPTPGPRMQQDNRSETTSENGNNPSPPLPSSLDPASWQQTRNELRNLYSRPAVDYNLLKSEFERLKTFMSVPQWPLDFIQPVDCARAGFYFVGEGDKVQCAFCRGVAGEWEEGDIPLVEHRRHFPRCPFICGLPVGNIPLGQENESTEEQQSSQGVDVCGHFAPETMGGLTILPQTSTQVQGAQPFSGALQDVAKNLKIKPFLGPANSQMITQPARLKTFKSNNWPKSIGQNIESLADAGFYYTGTSDQVKCFYCGGGLKNWVATDDPWTEHAKWFPFCTHVILNKGDDFIKSVEPQPASSPSNFSSDEDEVSSGVEAMEIEKPGSSAASSSGVETSSSNAGSDRGNSPVSDIPSSGVSSGEEDNEVPSPTASSAGAAKSSKPAPAPEESDENRLMCKICFDNDVGVVFLPCGHLVSCTTCATTSPTCPLCRQPIRGVVRAYLS